MTSRMHSLGTQSFGPVSHPAARLAELDRSAGAPGPVLGSASIAERLGSQLAAATGGICWLLGGSEPDAAVLERVAATVEAGRLRVLQHDGDRPVPAALAGAEVRVTTARPGHDFLLAGDDLAFIFDRDEQDRPVLTAVPQASVAKAFLGIFEHLWSTALPVTDLRQELGSEAKRIIIRMLGDGATDDAIARALGISRRTTARHVARIMHCTGSLSRFQAGMRLAQLGLLAGS
ncbi:MAG TPA: helix-turn-helix domain-containing protein [Jatrophihabitans sp.]|nr:helix-turn-helix domain-containing protein [Jatrophihabitans sp.]